MWKFIIVAFVTFLAVGGWCENFSFIEYRAIEKRQSQFEFIILHTNDMHARFEQTNFKSGTCSKDDAKKNKCCGGFARVAYQVRKHRKEAESGGLPVIFLNGGDTYTGTAWFTLFKHEIVTAFMNKLAPEAASLGNHEFDKNIVGLVPYINGASFPILSCNLDTKGEPDVASSKLLKSTILTVKDVKVGIIGFITPDTGFLASKNKLVFNEEISSINAEAKKLKAQGVNIMIAVGHSGYKKDQDIARRCPEVDVVVGGHSHSYLDANKPVADESDSNPEAVRGPYPTVVVRDNGQRVPVVQAYAFTKYIGKLKVKFDSNGNLKSFSGAPILLGPDIPQEKDMLELLEQYRPKIEELERTIYGKTNVVLEGGGICRRRECNLGNLISDAMVNARLRENKGKHWTDSPIALIQGGGIRASIEKVADKTINGATLLTVLPFENEVMMTRISGKKLLAALEHSARTWLRDSNGGFLQMSGLKVVYDYNKPDGHRVISARARCSNCSVPVYESIKEDAMYQVIVLQYVLEGGDGYDLNDKDNPHNERLSVNDIQCLINYLKMQQIVYPKMESRITILESDDGVLMAGSPIALLVLVPFLLRYLF